MIRLRLREDATALALLLALGAALNAAIYACEVSP